MKGVLHVNQLEKIKKLILATNPELSEEEILNLLVDIPLLPENFISNILLGRK